MYEPSEKKPRLNVTKSTESPLLCEKIDNVNPSEVPTTKRKFAAKSTGLRSKMKVKSEPLEKPSNNASLNFEVTTPNKSPKNPKLHARKSSGYKKMNGLS